MIKLLVKTARRITGPFVFRKSLPREFGGHKIYVSSRSDIRLLAPGFERTAKDLFLVVGKYVENASVVWDIGSNLGILSFASAAKTGAKGEVYSLEADPRYADIQTRTLKGFSGDVGKVSILCAAASDQLGILDLVIPKKGHSRNHLSVVAGNSAGEADTTKQVVTLDLDWLLGHWSPPNFIKIDVEGAEVLATKGAERLFAEIRPIGYIECSPDNSEALTAFFKRHNYDLFTLNEHGKEVSTESFAFNTVVKPRSLAS